MQGSSYVAEVVFGGKAQQNYAPKATGLFFLFSWASVLLLTGAPPALAGRRADEGVTISTRQRGRCGFSGWGPPDRRAGERNREAGMQRLPSRSWLQNRGQHGHGLFCSG